MVEIIANILTPSDGTVAVLSASLTAEAGTFTTAEPFPVALRGGDTRLRIGDELLLASVSAEGAVTFASRGVEGTTAAAHASGAKVRHVLTRAALASLNVAYVWDGDAEEYLLRTVQPPFAGPVDPADHGFTLGPGDVWRPTEEIL